MNIAILSDSHGSLDRLSELLENLQAAGIREVIHAGDFAVGRVVELFQKFPEINFHIARGNCDVNEETLAAVRELPNIELGEIIKTEIDGVGLVAAHKKADLAGSEARIIISGHTHVPEIKSVGKKLFLNPGSLMDDGEYLLVDLDSLKVERKLFNHSLV